MAEKQKTSSALKRLTPNSLEIKVDGKDIRVPVDKHENSILNMLTASQLRTLLQEQIKMYGQDGIKLTPQEISFLAKAGRDIAAFSAEIYANADPISPMKEKPAEKAPDEDIDFSKLNKPIDVKVEEKENGNETPKADA